MHKDVPSSSVRGSWSQYSQKLLIVGKYNARIKFVILLTLHCLLSYTIQFFATYFKRCRYQKKDTHIIQLFLVVVLIFKKIKILIDKIFCTLKIIPVLIKQ